MKKNVGEIERWVTLGAGAALTIAGLTRRSSKGKAALTLAGAGLIGRGLTGYCPVYGAVGMSTATELPGDQTSIPYERGVRVERAITIDKRAEELYRFWRNLENLPSFMDHLESVRVVDDTHSHWGAKAPGGTTIEWDAEIINDIPNELIGWRSLPSSEIANAGSVHFEPDPAGRGTVVHVILRYDPPGGPVGAALAKLFGEEPSVQIGDDLRRLKQLMESGEIATTDGQPRGARS